MEQRERGRSQTFTRLVVGTLGACLAIQLAGGDEDDTEMDRGGVADGYLDARVVLSRQRRKRE